MKQFVYSFYVFFLFILVGSSCMQDHQPAEPSEPTPQSYRPIDALVGSGSDRTQSFYNFIGYQEGNPNQFDPSKITPSTQFAMNVRDPYKPNTCTDCMIWVLDGGLIGAGFFGSVTLDNPYASITDWKVFISSAGGTNRTGGNGKGVTQPDEKKFIKYFTAMKAMRMDVVNGKTYLRIRALAEGETTPTVMVFMLM